MIIFFAVHFKKQLMHLKKKYPHIKEGFLRVIDFIDLHNEIYIGRSIYKIRISSTDMKRGKSGGFRAYMYLYLKKDLLVPLCIYTKSQTESITENELKYHFDEVSRQLFADLKDNSE